MDFLYGMLSGLTGLVPFLHTNLVLELFGHVTPAFAVALAFSHLAFEVFPTVFFGVPASGTAVSALPAQQLVQKGQGLCALFLAAAGLSSGALFAFLLAPAFLVIWPAIFPIVKTYSPELLGIVIAAAWVQDKTTFAALGVFFGSGLLGATVFGLPLNDSLFPLLSGLFGIPALLAAGTWNAQGKETTPTWSPLHALAASIASGFSVLLPALSPSFIASAAMFFIPQNAESVLLVTYAIVSSKMVFDFLATAVIHKARSAPAAVWLDNQVTLSQATPLLMAAALSLAAGVFLVWFFRKKLTHAFCIRIPPSALVGLVAFGVFFTNGPLGLFVLAWSSAWSVACMHLAPRKYLLGALMVPALAHGFGLAL